MLPAPPAGQVPVIPSQAEEFARFALECRVDNCAIVLLRPWSTGPAPPKVLTPRINREGKPGFPAEDVAGLVHDNDMVVIPCTFEYEQEVVAATSLFSRLKQQNAELCCVMVQLLPPNLQLSRECMPTIMRHQDTMFAIGASDVLLDPEQNHQDFPRILKSVQHSWRIDRQRVEEQLSSGQDGSVSTDKLRKLYKQHRCLLWESIPQALMPALKPLDRNLRETGDSVGSYKILGNLDTVSGSVLSAKDGDGVPRIIKIVHKSSVSYPEDVEDIYREYVFLSRLITHPNVVRMVDMLHSIHRIYLVFERAGDRNLAQLLRGMPFQRLVEPEGWQVFDQVLSALAFCHSKNVSHRSVCPEHVAVDQNRKCTLLDFRSAIVAKGDQTSRMQCGRLPCVAPQVASGGNYVPRKADSWSLGVLTMETVGGLGSLLQYCGLGPVPADAGSLMAAAKRIYQKFQSPSACASAVTHLGADVSQDLRDVLAVLIVPEEGGRWELQQLYQARAAKPPGEG
mmetsp:Transcript_92181/g.192735  ORF Transcript_92181/g.192735 Transcript_92181/m.192735 type:complete len:510 (-) Transcript_92181:172-1701(-)